MSKKEKTSNVDGRNHTAKKQKIQANKRGSLSHNTHSTSKNIKNYEIELDINDQPTHKKQLLTIKQLKMMIRCCSEYCSYKQQNYSHSQNYKIANEMLNHLRKNFKLVGPAKELKRYLQLFQKNTPLPQRQCQKCDQLGRICDEYQLQQIERNLQSEILRLEDQLEEQVDLSEQYMKMLQNKQRKLNNEDQLRNLREIHDLQVQVLEKLE